MMSARYSAITVIPPMSRNPLSSGYWTYPPVLYPRGSSGPSIHRPSDIEYISVHDGWSIPPATSSLTSSSMGDITAQPASDLECNIGGNWVNENRSVDVSTIYASYAYGSQYPLPALKTWVLLILALQWYAMYFGISTPTVIRPVELITPEDCHTAASPVPSCPPEIHKLSSMVKTDDATFLRCNKVISLDIHSPCS